MEKDLNSLQVRHKKGLILNPIQLEGNKQMAIDLMLLEKLIDESLFSMTMRFYTWDGIWLSIGKNQRNIPTKWLELYKSKKLNIVRRPSGGKAVLHSGGLTYSICWESPPAKKKESYLQASQWLINGFSQLGVKLHFGNQSSISPHQDCFATSTAADLIDERGQKRIGSAQYWRNGNLLQHGEILIEPPKDLWMEVFNDLPPKPLGISVSISKLQKLLIESLKTHWQEVIWEKSSLSKQDLKNIHKKSNVYLPKELLS